MAFINGKEILFSAVVTQGLGTKGDLDNIKQAILVKGGSITEDADFSDIADAIYDLPVGDTSYRLIESERVLVGEEVRSGAIGYLSIESFGGMNYNEMTGEVVDGRDVCSFLSTKVKTIESRCLNMFDEKQITGVTGLCSSSTPKWGEAKNGELIADRAYFAGTNKWLGFSMELTPGTYYMRAMCRIVKTSNNANRITLGLIKADETDRYALSHTTSSSIYIDTDGEWHDISTSITIKDASTYHLLAQAYGDSKNSTGYAYHFKNICISPVFIGRFVPYRDFVSKISIPPKILDLVGNGDGIYNASYPTEPFYNKVDLKNNQYIKAVDRYVFTGDEDIEAFGEEAYAYRYRVILPTTVDLRGSSLSEVTLQSDKYVGKTNSYEAYTLSAYNIIESGVDNGVYITSRKTTVEEFRQELRGTVLLYARKSPIVSPLPVKMDRVIEVEDNCCIRFITDTGRAIPYSISYLRKIE